MIRRRALLLGGVGLAAIGMIVGLFALGASAPRPVEEPVETSIPESVDDLTGIPYAELTGGECLDPFESAWQDRYSVVDCGQPHPGQLLVRAEFDDAPDAPWPGVDRLQSRMNLLCTAPTVLDVGATPADAQVVASYPVTEGEWAAGDRTYYCFVTADAPLTVSLVP